MVLRRGRQLVREHQHYRCLGKPLVAVWLHEYDALNQRIETVRPDGHRVSWLTYGSGHLVGLQLDDHELVSYERDDLHREIVRTQGNHLLQTQQWDALGRLNEQVLACDSFKGPQGQADGGRLLVRRYRYDAGDNSPTSMTRGAANWLTATIRWAGCSKHKAARATKPSPSIPPAI